MKFFQIVLDRWSISLLVVIYVVGYFYTVRRYHSELSYLRSGGGRIVRGFVFIGLFLIAPYLRRKLKKQWLAENPITLYYNTVNGITVVMTEAMYEANMITTKRHRRNAMWDKNVLMPNTDAFLFVDANGFEMFKCNSGTNTSDPIEHRHVSGWLTSLDDLVEFYKITLEQKPEIFVPFVNQSVLPFAHHLYRRHGVESYELELVVGQAPKEMQPLR